MNVVLSVTAANAAADAIAALLDGGYCDIFEGPQPESIAEGLPRGTKLLASLKLGSPAFRKALDGTARANAMQPDKEAKDTGRPQWFRLYRADHREAAYDGDITPGPGGALQMRALVIGKGTEVYIESCVLRMPLKAART